MAFWFANISDEFKNQKNFSYFNTPPHQIVFQQLRSDLNTQAPEFHSPMNSPRNELSISLDFINEQQDFECENVPTGSIDSPRTKKKKGTKIVNTKQYIKVYNKNK
jgi:hypothetical protein